MDTHPVPTVFFYPPQRCPTEYIANDAHHPKKRKKNDENIHTFEKLDCTF